MFIFIGLEILLSMFLAFQPKKADWSYIPANLMAVGLCTHAIIKVNHLKKGYVIKERKEDTLVALQEEQQVQQLEFLGNAATNKITEKQTQQEFERELKKLQQTAPILEQILKATQGNGAIATMALGMLQKDAPLGDVLLAVSEAQMKLQQAEMNAQVQIQQQKLVVEQQRIQQQQPIVQTHPTVALPTQEVATTQPQVSESSVKATNLVTAAKIAGINTQCLKIDKAPSYERYVFQVKTEDYKSLSNWQKAAQLALGEQDNVPFYIFGAEQIAIEVTLPASERLFYDFPVRSWEEWKRLIVVGQSLEGEVVIDLGNEDSPHILCVGTTGSGKSNWLRCVAYCLLMQDCRVDICGGKVSDYEDFTARFSSIQMSDLGRTAEIVKEYFIELVRRNSLTKEELANTQPWILIIDEYKGTVPSDEASRKIYDEQLGEIARRGRGLKVHIVIGVQKGSKRGNDDPQGIPPDLRSVLPCRVAFHCVERIDGQMVLHSNGENVVNLSGKGDGIIQCGTLRVRIQAYRFETIPG